jgi:hypothetical protein
MTDTRSLDDGANASTHVTGPLISASMSAVYHITSLAVSTRIYHGMSHGKDTSFMHNVDNLRQSRGVRGIALLGMGMPTLSHLVVP